MRNLAALMGVKAPIASPLEKALYALVREKAMHRTSAPLDAKSIYADDRTVQAIITKADAIVGTTSTSGFASQLTQTAFGDFIASLAPISAAARIIAQGVSMPFPTGTARQTAPAREGAPSALFEWVGEAEPIPVHSYTLNDDCVLEPRKFAMIVVITREVAKRANGEAVIRLLLREDAAVTLDSAYFGNTAASSSAHAGLLASLPAAATGYSGGDRMAMEQDLLAITEAVAPNGSGQIAYVMSPQRAARFGIKFPDLDLQVVPSLAVADNVLIGIDPLSLAHGFGEDFDIDTSREAVVHMSDDPLPIVDAAGVAADPTRSLYQTDAMSVRLIADVAFCKRRPGAVAWISGPTW